MSILERMKDMTRATFNDMLEKTEDPVRAIEQYLAEQKRSLYELEQLYRDQLQHAYRVRSQLKEAVEMAERREKQAELAIKAGEEELAKMALEDKLKQLDKASRYEDLATQSRETITELEARIDELKADIQEVSDQKQFYADRMESIRLQQQMNERKQRTGQQATSWFHRLEDLIQDLEIEARAYFDVKTSSDRVRQTRTNQSKLDLEMEKLKRKMEEKGGGGE